MKTINEYMNLNEDRYDNYERECKYSAGNNKIIFENQAALMLYVCEFMGQISDGEWENARPEYHWLWVAYTKNFEFGKELGYKGVHHKKKYALSTWDKLWDKTGYEFAYRDVNYAKFGHILGESKVYSADEYEALQMILEFMKPEKEQEFEEFVSDSYISKYYDLVKSIFTKENYDKFYNLTYSDTDYTKDLKSCAKSINTYLK